jgi:hypothetical protein
MGVRRTVVVCGLLVALACATAGCSQSRSVDFYRTHPAIRALTSDHCVATGSNTQNCRNAKQASFEALGVPAHDGRADPGPAR